MADPKITPGPAQKVGQPPSQNVVWPDAPSATKGPGLPTVVPGQTTAVPGKPNNK